MRNLSAEQRAESEADSSEDGENEKKGNVLTRSRPIFALYTDEMEFRWLDRVSREDLTRLGQPFIDVDIVDIYLFQV